METEMNRLLQSEQSDRTPCHVVGIEDCERTHYSLRIKYLTDYCSRFFILRVSDEYRLATQVMQRRRMVDVAGLCTAPIRVDELVEKLAPGLARGRDPEHPEVPVWSGKLTWNNRREIRSQGIINHRSLDQLIALHVNHKSRGLALAYIREQVRHYLVLVIDGMVEFQDVNHQPALFLIAIDEVQAIAIADWNRRHLLAGLTTRDQ